MKKKIIISILTLVGLATVIAIVKVNRSNSKPPQIFKTENLKKQNIVNKVVATGKVIPNEEIEIKPQITGIIDKIFLQEGTKVKKGDLIARVRVVPNEQSLISAKGRVDNAKIRLKNAQISYSRNKALYEKQVLAAQDFENIELTYQQAQQELINAENDYQIIKSGSSGAGGFANTDIRAQISGTILEIPVKEGDQVIQSNNFNAGTTIASIADMSKMIFEGKVDEAEVGKLKLGMNLDIVIGAIEDQVFQAGLNFIAPKGIEESGAVQFKVKGDLSLGGDQYIRANYSANASIIIQKRDSVFSIREALLQYNRDSKQPYVEVEKEDGSFENRDVELGVSDGIHVEIISGLKEDENIKVWNKESKKEEDEE